MEDRDCDIAIIGSGFGGSVCALRAAEAGLRTVVLERGPRLSADDYEDMAAGKRPLHYTARQTGSQCGLAEAHAIRGLGALTASAVGGGSHLYTSVTIPAREEIFTEAWCGLSRFRVEPYYERALEVISPQPAPATTARTAALFAAAEKLGATATPLPLSVNWPADAHDLEHVPSFAGVRREAVTWLRGGRACRKRTLDTTYLARAEARGAEILPLHEVTAIAPRSDVGYDLRVRVNCDSGNSDTILHAKRVVLAAGALGTIRLLFQCRDVLGTLPRVSGTLGDRFLTNGDFGGLILAPRHGVPPDSGPATTAWVDLWQEDRMFLMELGVWPAGLGLSSLATRWGSAWCFAAMGFDENPCRLRMSSRGELAMERNADRSAPFERRRLDRLRELARALGGMLLAPPYWIDRRLPTTVHAMGGAIMSRSSAEGVANPFGEVHGHPGLYIADSSLFPTPTGNAPSLTIAAVAEYVMDHLLNQAGGRLTH